MLLFMVSLADNLRVVQIIQVTVILKQLVGLFCVAELRGDAGARFVDALQEGMLFFVQNPYVPAWHVWVSQCLSAAVVKKRGGVVRYDDIALLFIEKRLKCAASCEKTVGGIERQERVIYKKIPSF